MGEGRHCGIRLAFDTLTPQHARANTHTESSQGLCCRLLALLQTTDEPVRQIINIFFSSLEVKHAKKKEGGDPSVAGTRSHVYRHVSCSARIKSGTEN